MQTSSLVWTRPRGPRLVYTIYYNKMYRVRKACTIHKKCVTNRYVNIYFGYTE